MEDIKEIQKFTQAFETRYKDRLNLSPYKVNEFKDYIGYGAESVYTNPKPDNFKETKWRKNPQSGMLWISTDINPNGITSKDDIGRTYTIKFEQTFQERRKYAREFSTGMIHHFYAYGRTIDEVMEKFDKYLYERLGMEFKDKKYDVISPDGFSISRDQIWDTPEEAIEAAKEWVKGYERQGYYSSSKFGRIDLDDVLDYCELKEVEPVEEVEVDDINNEPF